MVVLIIGQAFYVVEKFPHALHSSVSCVMGRKAAADFKFRCKRREIILGPFLICIDKDKIEGTLQFLHQLMGICKPGVDIFR